MSSYRKISFILLGLVSFGATVTAQTLPWSQRMTATVMHKWPDSLSSKWTYDNALVLKGIENVWKRTADGKYFNYIQKNMDPFVDKDGNIRGYKKDDYNIDNINGGRNFLMLYEVTGIDKYRKGAANLRDQLNNHPRTSEGGFWHKKRYPSQMWLDGLYMGEPFYAEYTGRFEGGKNFDDVAKQFILMEKHGRDAKTGLLYHAWDESKEQQWANKTTGVSPNFWGRAMGWYAMALVDVLDYFPASHPKRDSLVQILNRLATAVTKVQDKSTGLWWQVLDKGGMKDNYLEASASCMLVYALAKGTRLGYLKSSFGAAAQKGFNGIIKNFMSVDDAGFDHLNRVCQVAGLGGSPYRDGSYAYYMSEPIITDDAKGVGAFIQAAVEIEIANDIKPGKGKTVVLDNYFNSETKKDPATGNTISWHYQWDEQDNGGYSFLQNIFNGYGAKTKTLSEAPTAANLKGANVYVIVDPDIPKENPNTHYIESQHIKSITDWVKKGGTLVIMMNDSGNAEFDHTNMLVKQFGMKFEFDSKNRVTGNNFIMGEVVTEKPNVFFTSKGTSNGSIRRLYVKEFSPITVTPPAVTEVSNSEAVIMAIAKFGKGKVFAMGDPWIYNEYVDGRKLPDNYENFLAAQQWVQWLFK